MTIAPSPQPYLLALDTYIAGKSKLAGKETVIKLSSNENPNGPSPKALAAYESAQGTVHRYPEDGALSLREAIAGLHGFDAQQIICGAGSDDVIRMLCMAYGGAGREVIYSQYGFAMYRIYALQSGAVAVAAPERNLCTDIDALLAAVKPNTSLVFLANPNNPTGSYLPKAELHRLRAGLREDILLVIDGAYAEYMTPETAPDFSDGRELTQNTNTVLMRTFSKAYGLGGLRIGWGYGQKEIIEMLYKVRSPFNLTQPSLNAAIAALADQDYIAQHVAQSNQERARLEAAIAALGIQVNPSLANFVLLGFSEVQGRRASDAAAHLAAQGIIVREIANYGLPNHLRITVGTPAENDAMLTALTDWCQ